MQKFYFTYGTEGHPFVGGWTTIEAPSKEIAITIFRSLHPDRIEGLINCASIYEEADFRHTSMYKHGNFGERDHEIVLSEYVNVNNESTTLCGVRHEMLEVLDLLMRRNCPAQAGCFNCKEKKRCDRLTKAVEALEDCIERW